MNDGHAFLAEANAAPSQHLATFQGNIELWVADHQRKMTQVKEELRRARDEIRWFATRIPLHGSPRTRRLSPEPLQLWRSPVRPPSTSNATVPAAPPPLPSRPTLRSPIRLVPASPVRRQRRPALPLSSPPEPPLPPCPAAGGRGARGGRTPPRPGRPQDHPCPRHPPAKTTTIYTYRTFPRGDPRQAQGNQQEHR